MTADAPAAGNGPVLSWGEWGSHDATALAALVRRGEITAREVSQQAVAAIAMLDPELEAVVGLFDDVVEHPDTDGPNRDGQLYGVPILLKDIGSGMAGRLQECGSALYRGARMSATDPLVENMLNAGLVPLGRSTTPELGLTLDTVTSYRGKLAVTRNPWDKRLTAGGSSGGAGAVVASGMMPVAGSADGGGSTRVPASFCGLVGLKATRGRVPQPIARSEYTLRIYIEGVLTRSVRDTAAVYETLTRVPNGGSFIPMSPPRGSYLAALEQPPGRLRIGLSTGGWGRPGGPDPQVVARTREVGRLLEELGHDVEEIDDARICDWDVLWDGYITQWMSGRATLAGTARERGIAADDLEHHVEPMTFRHYLAAARYDKFDIYRMMDCNRQVTRSFGRLMEQLDILLTPTLAIRVPEANGKYSLLRNEEIEPWVGRLVDACRYTMPANETGLPAISIPAGLDAEGLPIGVQFYGNFLAEDVLLRLAAQVEAARPDWFGATPPVHVARRRTPT